MNEIPHPGFDKPEEYETFTTTNDLEEAAEKYRRESYSKSILPNIDGPMPEYVGSVKDAFIAGAKWQEEQDLKCISEIHRNGYNLCKEQMMKKAVDGEVDFEYFGYKVIRPDLKQLDTLLESMNHGDKVRIIIVKED